MPRHTIDRSVNFNGISMTAGAWLMVIGVASFFVSIGKQNGYALIVAVIFLLLAALVTLSIRHIAIDHELRRICCYTVYPSMQKPNWLPLDAYTGVVVQRITGTITIRSRNHYYDERYATFAVSLTNADHSDRLLLREFSEYADAIRFQAKIAEITQLAPVPGFERVSE